MNNIIILCLFIDIITCYRYQSGKNRIMWLDDSEEDVKDSCVFYYRLGGELLEFDLNEIRNDKMYHFVYSPTEELYYHPCPDIMIPYCSNLCLEKDSQKYIPLGAPTVRFADSLINDEDELTLTYILTNGSRPYYEVMVHLYCSYNKNLTILSVYFYIHLFNLYYFLSLL